jgi:hypothetical protein
MIPDSPQTPSALSRWFTDLLSGPIASNGDYFDRLRDSVESSAPVSRTCC